MLGYKHSSESIAKMRGRTHSVETKLLITEAMTGKTHSAETKVLISQAMKGENNPMFGITGENHPQGFLGGNTLERGNS